MLFATTTEVSRSVVRGCSPSFNTEQSSPTVRQRSCSCSNSVRRWQRSNGQMHAVPTPFFDPRVVPPRHQCRRQRSRTSAGTCSVRGPPPEQQYLDRLFAHFYAAAGDDGHTYHGGADDDDDYGAMMIMGLDAAAATSCCSATTDAPTANVGPTAADLVYCGASMIFLPSHLTGAISPRGVCTHRLQDAGVVTAAARSRPRDVGQSGGGDGGLDSGQWRQPAPVSRSLHLPSTGREAGGGMFATARSKMTDTSTSTRYTIFNMIITRNKKPKP